MSATETRVEETPGVTPEDKESTQEAPESGVEGLEVETPSEDPEAERERLSRELSSVRAEAAKWRTRLRETEAALAEAKTVDDIESVRSEFSAKVSELETELIRERVAHKFGLPPELATRLQGGSQEEIEADAKALARFAVSTPSAPLRGGLDPTTAPDDYDPVAYVANSRRRQY